MSEARALLEGRYAIIGYGSLIWDLDDLAPHVTLPWAMAQGPRLPMEFSRISPKRKLGLVVVLDDENGTPCHTHAIASVREDIHATVGDLAARERASASLIGAVCLGTGHRSAKSDTVAEEVRDWCASVGARGAVWTDLARNFHTETRQSFSVEAALDYLKTLRGESLEEAVRYINSAPHETDTPLRRHLADSEWWTEVSR